MSNARIVASEPSKPFPNQKGFALEAVEWFDAERYRIHGDWSTRAEAEAIASKTKKGWIKFNREFGDSDDGQPQDVISLVHPDGRRENLLFDPEGNVVSIVIAS